MVSRVEEMVVEWGFTVCLPDETWWELLLIVTLISNV